MLGDRGIEVLRVTAQAIPCRIISNAPSLISSRASEIQSFEKYGPQYRPAEGCTTKSSYSCTKTIIFVFFRGIREGRVRAIKA